MDIPQTCHRRHFLTESEVGSRVPPFGPAVALAQLHYCQWELRANELARSKAFGVDVERYIVTFARSIDSREEFTLN
jgi:hypothetical protein